MAFALAGEVRSVLHGAAVRGQLAPRDGRDEKVADEPAEVRRGRGQSLVEAAREDLDLFAVAELHERIEALEAEIARVRAQIDRKEGSRAAADALFSTSRSS